MNLRPIPPPVVPPLDPRADHWRCTRAWDSDDYVFYFIPKPVIHLRNAARIWVHKKETGIGGRVISPPSQFDTFQDFLHIAPDVMWLEHNGRAMDPETLLLKWIDGEARDIYNTPPIVSP